MSFLSDLRVLYHIVAKPVRGKDHAARLESFYGGQAAAYDDFRRRLLLGREAMYQSIPVPEGGVWVDLGRAHAARLESFYGGQAAAYDDFRRRLLLGREAMYQSIPVPEGGVWVDLG